MNKSTLHETLGRKTKVHISRSNWFRALSLWILLLAALMVPKVLQAQWQVTVGAETGNQGGQALAFLPNEIWIHVGDDITWTFNAGEIHTVTFLTADQVRPAFADGCPGFTASPASFDGSTCLTTPPLVKGAIFKVTFPKVGNYKLVCLVHENMTGTVHVLGLDQPLPHDQAFYDRQAVDQRQALLSDTDGNHNGEHHQDCDHFAAHLVIAGRGETSATAGGAEGSTVLRFKNDKITIKAGQTVEWNNEDPVTPHTVTFGMEPANLMVPSGNVTVDPDGAVHGSISSMGENLHSGFIIAAPQERLGIPQAPLGNTRFRVTFKNPGTFNYICALHDDLGMTGMVIVYP
jgi:plastocyanin